MMNRLSNEKLKRKLRRERVELCMNCERFVNCQDVGELEQCEKFLEIKNEAWVTRKI